MTCLIKRRCRGAQWPRRGKGKVRSRLGLAALAKMLSVDAANLGKVIKGKREPSEALLAKIDAMRLQQE
jgi:hypothetical protein